MITDYYIIRRNKLNLARLYKLGPGGDLWYTHGVNLRAVVAFAVA
jgi:NCS1 family nucleobase:cation symporter-1